MNAARPPSQSDKVHQKALEAIVGAQYADMIGAPAAARARAQTAYTIASATASVLVAAGIFADIRRFPVVVQVLGGAALIGWVVAAALFMLVARRVSIALKSARAPNREEDETTLLDETEFATRAVQTASDVASEIDDRLDNAIVTSLVALALTVATFFTAFLAPAKPERVAATLVLKDQGVASMRALCGAETELVQGRVEVDSIGEDFTVFEIPAGRCGPGSAVTLRFPKAAVRAILVRDGG